MSRGGGVKRYSEGKEVKGQRPVPADVGARPDQPSPEVVEEMRKNRAKRGRNAPQRQKAPTLSPEDMQRMREKIMDAKLQEAARKPPNERGYSRGGMARRFSNGGPAKKPNSLGDAFIEEYLLGKKSGAQFDRDSKKRQYRDRVFDGVTRNRKQNAKVNRQDRMNNLLSEVKNRKQISKPTNSIYGTPQERRTPRPYNEGGMAKNGGIANMSPDQKRKLLTALMKRRGR